MIDRISLFPDFSPFRYVICIQFLCHLDCHLLNDISFLERHQLQLKGFFVKNFSLLTLSSLRRARRTYQHFVIGVQLTFRIEDDIKYNYAFERPQMSFFFLCRVLPFRLWQCILFEVDALMTMLIEYPAIVKTFYLSCKS